MLYAGLTCRARGSMCTFSTRKVGQLMSWPSTPDADALRTLASRFFATARRSARP